MDVELDGRQIRSVEDFHTEISRALDFGPYYGKNFDALWDRISFDVGRPVRLTWRHAAVSRRAMGKEAFGKIEEILRLAEQKTGTSERSISSRSNSYTETPASGAAASRRSSG